MKVKEIKDLINFIAESNLQEVEIETDDITLRVKRSEVLSGFPVSPSPVVLPAASSPQSLEKKTDDEAEKAPAAQAYIEIKSPMIGTFYRASNPESAPFVAVGDEVSVGKVVCIVEAMKLFNEIESEVSGKIVKVLVDNATPVEYDQPLFLVEPH